MLSGRSIELSQLQSPCFPSVLSENRLSSLVWRVGKVDLQSCSLRMSVV